jgi:hypothetical protein
MFARLNEEIDKLLAFEGQLDVLEVCRAVERLEFLKLRVIREFDASGDWAADGALSTQGWLRVRTRCAQPVEMARRLGQLPETSAAFSDGAITRHHARVITDACTPARAAALADVEEPLVEIARRVTPQELRGVVRRLTDALDGDGGAAADEAAFARRALQVAWVGAEGVIQGTAEPVGHEIIATALDAEMERDFERADPRSRGQRRYDALVNICRRALDNGEVGGSRGARPHVLIVEDLAEIEERAPLVATGIRADATHVGRLSRATLELLSCDCSVSRVITRGRSEILDLGRSTRTVSWSQWKALVVRDRHCQAPGCDRPPGDCQAHHIVQWTKNGPTNLKNLQLLCWRHHRNAHLLRE